MSTRKKTNENTTQGGHVNDGPRFMYGNRATYMKYATRMASKLGMSVEDWIMDMGTEFELGDGRDDVVDTVSYFPTGDAGSTNKGTDNHPEIPREQAYNLWAARAEKLATVANDVTVVTMGGEESKKEPISEGAETGINTGSADDQIVEWIPVEGGYRQYIADHVDHLGASNVIELWMTELINLYEGESDDGIDMLLESSMVDILGEKTYKDLRKDAPYFLRIRDKSKSTPGSRFIGIDDMNICHFKTPSHTIPGVTYEQSVKLVDLENLIKTQSGRLKPIEIVQMAIEGNIEVHCTDPSWRYWGFQYIGTKDDYSILPEPRYPKIRNPQLKGSVCKHLDNVLFVLPFQNTKILKDLIDQQRL